MSQSIDLQHLKSANFTDAVSKAIICEGQPELLLVPIGTWIFGQPEMIAHFAQWRSAVSHLYFSQIKPTPESMAKYLRDTSVSEPDAVLFAIFDQQLNLLGHSGIRHATQESCELDSIMKNPESTLSGLMFRTIAQMMSQVNESLGITAFGLKTLSTNLPAISLYRKLGFVIEREIPLMETNQNGVTRLLPAELGNANRKEQMLLMRRLVSK
jgi:RimJ/RimL family protein N-acetyltransferase